jgi:hypothetical protein
MSSPGAFLRLAVNRHSLVRMFKGSAVYYARRILGLTTTEDKSFCAGHRAPRKHSKLAWRGRGAIKNPLDGG